MPILEEEEFNPVEEIETTNIIDININVSFIDLIKKRKKNQAQVFFVILILKK